MRFVWDAYKNERSIHERGIDFADVVRVFDGPVVVARDERRDYGEARWVGLGALDGRVVVVVWTYRLGTLRIISARKANTREAARYEEKLSPAG